jgi:hypothetical protein
MLMSRRSDYALISQGKDLQALQKPVEQGCIVCLEILSIDKFQ